MALEKSKTKNKKIEELLKEELDFLLQRDFCPYVKFTQHQVVAKENDKAIEFNYFVAYCTYSREKEKCEREICKKYNGKNHDGDYNSIDKTQSKKEN
jgi:hypothetical protein